MTVGATKSHGDVIAEDLAADHGQSLALGRVDLPRHNGGACVVIEEGRPGSFSGSISSPRPQRGPLPSSRMSEAIFIKEAAIVLQTPLASTHYHKSVKANEFQKESSKRPRHARPEPRTCSPRLRKDSRSVWQFLAPPGRQNLSLC